MTDVRFYFTAPGPPPGVGTPVAGVPGVTPGTIGMIAPQATSPLQQPPTSPEMPSKFHFQMAIYMVYENEQMLRRSFVSYKLNLFAIQCI